MIKTILWDFDGVLMDSNAVRDLGFVRVLCDFPKEQVDQLLEFHQQNGGLSRYVKFRFFFEEIRNEAISEGEILKWADRFSIIMKELLVNSDLLIHETLNFVKENQELYNMHITSGSDQNELRFLCKALGIDHLFTSIHGSPTPKNQLVADLIKEYQYNIGTCVLIGDSVNDFEAAVNNGIKFLGYGNAKIKELSSKGVNLFEER